MHVDSALRRKLSAGVFTSPRLFDKFGGRSIHVIEYVLQKAEAQLPQN